MTPKLVDLFISILNEEDFKELESLKKEVRGFEFSSSFFMNSTKRFDKKWFKLKLEKYSGLNLHPRVFEVLRGSEDLLSSKALSVRLEWEEKIKYYQFDWITSGQNLVILNPFLLKSRFLIPEKTPILFIHPIQMMDPFFDSALDESLFFKVTGKHTERWVRRYSKKQIDDFFKKLLKKRKSLSPFIILSYSGRKEQLCLFSKYSK